MTNITNTERLKDVLRSALVLCEWIDESPHQRGSINGQASQVAHNIRAALAEAKPGPVSTRLVEALKFYADKDHLMIADPDAWDTVSGEPENYLCDDAGTATVEDGSVARAALAEAEGQAVPAVAIEGVGMHRLMKSEQGKFAPASEWFTGNTDPSWEKLEADEPDSWRIQRRVTGKQIATGIAKAFATPYVAPSVAESVAHLWQHSETGRTRVVMSDQIITAEACWQVVGPLFLHPPAPREPLTVDAAIGLLVDALAASKGWLRGYADATIRHALDYRGAPREPLTVDEVRARFDLPFISDAKAERISAVLVGLGIGTDREGG